MAKKDLPISSDGARKDVRATSSRTDIDAFLARASVIPAKAPGVRGRLIFALDATASRRPTWDHAAHIQAEMFAEAGRLGGLDIQLAYYGGFGEFHAGDWTHDGDRLLRQMTAVTCMAGETQIAKVLRHGAAETRRKKVNALVFIGDSLEEDVDHLGKLAGELGLLGVPVFVFHEGQDPVAGYGFQQIAKLSGGAYCQFDEGSAQTLRDLLRAVAAFAAGGPPALEDFARRHGGQVRLIAQQMKPASTKGGKR